MGLPSFIMLKSSYNKKLLRLAEELKSRPYGYLQFSGDGVFDSPPAAKFELEMADCDNGLVHIRCCYNNKYWVRLEDQWISSTALKPEEDQSKKSCTLFKPMVVDDQVDAAADTLVRLLHVQSGYYVCLFKEYGEPFDSCLYATRRVYDPDSSDVFAVVDADSLVKLPKFVAFRGDNGKRLGFWLQKDDKYPRLKFSFDDNYSYPADVTNEVFTNPDGTIRLKSVSTGKFWTAGNSGEEVALLPHSDDDATCKKGSDHTLFSAFKMDEATIALRNVGNNLFCRRFYSPETSADFLGTRGSYILNRSVFKVEDLTLRRKIYNVKFRFRDVRIYNQRAVVVAVGIACNNTDKPRNLDVKLSYADTKVSCWKSLTPTLKNLGVKTTINSGIPLMSDELKLQVAGDFQGEYKWPGESKELTMQMESLYSFSLQPKSKVTVKLIAKTATYDVPFSYRQRDSLMTGAYANEDLDDGVFTGANYFDCTHEAKEEKLESDKKKSSENKINLYVNILVFAFVVFIFRCIYVLFKF